MFFLFHLDLSLHAGDGKKIWNFEYCNWTRAQSQSYHQKSDVAAKLMNREKKGIISHVRNNVDSYCKACRNDSNPVGPVPNRFFLVSLSSFRICCAAASSTSPRGQARPQGAGAPPRARLALAASTPCRARPAAAGKSLPCSRREHALQRVLPPSGSPSPARTPWPLPSHGGAAAEPIEVNQSSFELLFKYTNFVWTYLSVLWNVEDVVWQQKGYMDICHNRLTCVCNE